MIYIEPRSTVSHNNPIKAVSSLGVSNDPITRCHCILLCVEINVLCVIHGLYVSDPSVLC